MDRDLLMRRAVEARDRAYAPYSDYAVGAALLTLSGKIHIGCNVENASYGLTNCAERTALFSAVAAGERDFAAIAISTRDSGAPCGACRQVMNEFAPELIVLLGDESGVVRYERKLSDLLPDAFGPHNLSRSSSSQNASTFESQARLPMSDKISPCFWYNGTAEEAVNLYISLIPDSRITAVTRYGEGAPLPAGEVMTITFELQGRSFMAINGGPQFEFSPAISMMANCDTQAEIDELWVKLSEGGQQLQCGWLQDRFGVSWQIVPSILTELMSGDEAKSNRVMQALWGMEKLDIETLKRAAAG